MYSDEEEAQEMLRRRATDRTRAAPLSKSVVKARIELGRARRIVDIPRFHPRPIPARGAFATDLDMFPPESVPGAPPVPPHPRREPPNPAEPGQ